MHIEIKISLGNAAMRTALDVAEAVAESLDGGYDAELTAGMDGFVRDDNGNTVGTWKVEA